MSMFQTLSKHKIGDKHVLKNDHLKSDLTNKNKLIQPKPSCSCGGECPGCKIQGRLRQNQLINTLVQHQDCFAEKIMRTHTNQVDYECTDCNKEMELVMRMNQKPIYANSERLPYSATNKLTESLANGNTLDVTTRDFMESRFGFDFGKVRIHTGEKATKTAESIGALAYTVGNDIVFSEGQHRPHEDKGRRLLAHELAHVVQQNSSLESLPTNNLILRKEDGRKNTDSLPYDTTYGPSSNHCNIYQSDLAKPWLTWSLRHNATCACENTPDDPHDNCVRKCLQVKLQKYISSMDKMGAALPDTFPLEADPICHDFWKQHVECYGECGCSSGFINYPTFSTMCRSPFPCFFVGKTISWFNSCM